MKIAIINCFDTYSERVENIKKYFEENLYDVSIIQSNYKHFKKEYITKEEMTDDKKWIHTIPYKRNLSLKRIFSHYIFAKNAFKEVEKYQPDIIYVLIPPNFLSEFSKRYKKRYPNVKIVFDLIDLWPETLPVGTLKKKFPFSLWAGLRNNSFSAANKIITECDLYQKELLNELKNSEVETLYLSKNSIEQGYYELSKKNHISFCYLGSINNIIDIPKIKKIIEESCKYNNVTLHIIGDGENRENFLAELNKTDAEVIFHGKVYDLDKKQKIFNSCHYGLNIMKESVCVGLTMKSLDYFQSSLPIINNIPGDTYYIVEKQQIGFNITEKNIVSTIKNISSLKSEEHYVLKKNTELVFNNEFSQQAFNKKMDKIFNT